MHNLTEIYEILTKSLELDHNDDIQTWLYVLMRYGVIAWIIAGIRWVYKKITARIKNQSTRSIDQKDEKSTSKDKDNVFYLKASLLGYIILFCATLPAPVILNYLILKFFHLEHSTDFRLKFLTLLLMGGSCMFMVGWVLYHVTKDVHLCGKIICDEALVNEYQSEGKNGKTTISCSFDWANLHYCGIHGELLFGLQKFLILKVDNHERIRSIHFPLSMKGFDRFHEIVVKKIGITPHDIEYSEFRSLKEFSLRILKSPLKRIRK